MAEWGHLGTLFDTLASHSPMLGRLWLFLMLVFRIVILGTVADDLFEDEQEEFTCNTLQPGCKQMCYNMAFPISQYRFWVLHIVLIATPSLVFLLYAIHHHNKRVNHLKGCKYSNENFKNENRFRKFYIINLLLRIGAEVGFLAGQWKLYGFEVKEQFECERYPCPKIVDCFVSRPAEKTVFLYFYFIVGILSVVITFLELWYCLIKWFFRPTKDPPPRDTCDCLDDNQEVKENAKNEQIEESTAGRNSSRKSQNSRSGVSENYRKSLLV